MTRMIEHRFIKTNGIQMHIAEAGRGPVVIFCHGWPELSHSWHHQLSSLAEAGFQAVAPDMRGYGETDVPWPVEAYTQQQIIGDVIGLIDVLGAENVVIVGHDWGAPIAWHTAMMRPDRIRAVVGMSVPHRPRGTIRPTEGLAKVAIGQFNYFRYFQQPGVAEAELEQDIRSTVRRILYMKSGDAPEEYRWQPVNSFATGFLSGTIDPEILPSWLTEEDVDIFVKAFARTGYRGSLNWYRNYDRTWEGMAPFSGAKVPQPALYIGGSEDRAMDIPGFREALAELKHHVPNLRSQVIIDGAGHWVQMERPKEVTRALIEFLDGL